MNNASKIRGSTFGVATGMVFRFGSRKTGVAIRHRGYLRPLPSPSRICRAHYATSSKSSQDVESKKYPIVIVGGGPSGLFMAALLQRYGVQDVCLLEGMPFEQQFQHPQAHFLNTRTMEILKNCTPDIYERVQEAMPPVDEWNAFQFAPTMTSRQILARVQHPVHAPLVAGADANGVLLEKSQVSTTFPADDMGGDAIPLSDCSVGHLAQHTFQRILYEHVQGNMTEDGALHFGSKVVEAHYDDSTQTWSILTDSGQMFQTPLVVAADGAKSSWREERLGISMTGQPVIQRLINVHFTLKDPAPSTAELPPAMLYTVFSSQVLAMVVRHSATDYVMQIPYFPPYQTLGDDFAMSKVQEMVRAAIGDDKIDFDIRSIRPWTMGSLVAESYGQNGVYLVGDAAHVFPPAGGFGMNTGLQDAVALAWRLALLLRATSTSNSIHTESNNISEIYTKERQAVAYQNAALSVRNYNRVLGVMKSCYLDERNLPILLASLEASSKLGVPLAWQKATFQNLFRAALMPLAMLKDRPSSPYSQHVQRNLQSLLGSGQGLPLLFPGHELAFSYPTLQDENDEDSGPTSKSKDDWARDSIAPTPKLKAGKLMPHIPCRVVSNSNISNMKMKAITTTIDLSTQVATMEQPCPFVLLRIVKASTTAQGEVEPDYIKDILSLRVSKDGDLVQVALVDLWIEEEAGSFTNGTSLQSFGMAATLATTHAHWTLRALPPPPLWVLMRPDGHVAGLFPLELEQKTLIEELRKSIQHAYHGNLEGGLIRC